VGQGKVIAAGKWGKWKTTFQMVTITVILLFNTPCFASWYTGILTGVSVALTLWSAVDYFWKNKSVFGSKLGPAAYPHLLIHRPCVLWILWKTFRRNP
jgi:CDP-diacylglycerol--glycerol-3-phosphate 3-phosphatidyltransferase